MEGLRWAPASNFQGAISKVQRDTDPMPVPCVSSITLHTVRLVSLKGKGQSSLNLNPRENQQPAPACAKWATAGHQVELEFGSVNGGTVSLDQDW